MSQIVFSSETTGPEPDGPAPLPPVPAGPATELLPPVPPGPGDDGPDRDDGPVRRPPAVDRPLYVVSSMLTIVSVLALTFGLTVGLIGSVRHARDQQTGYATLRGQLANATAVVSQTDEKGRLQRLGTPLAVLDIPQIGVREVVFEGTTSGVLSSGPGHRRDTPMPGQEGTSVIMGRQAAYGGPFKNLRDLAPGNVFTVTTGQGRQTFRVIARRLAGDPVPPPVKAGKGRLILISAAGVPWVPEGTLRVDADLVSTTQPAGPRPLTAASLPTPERALEGDPSVWVWVMLLTQALFGAAVAVTWGRFRWGGWQAWLVGGPLLLALGVALADQIAQLLPNLL
jgi:sortase A